MSVTAAVIDSTTASVDKDGYTTYTQKWRVTTSDRTDGPKTVLAYPGVPRVGSTYTNGYETDGTAAFTGGRTSFVEEKESLRYWLYECTFSNNPDDGSDRDPEEPPEEPWNEPPQVSTYAVKDREPFLYDLNNHLVASSAGEPYDPVVERDCTRYMLRIVMTQLDVNPPFYAQYRDAVNDDPFFGCAPQTVKCEVPGAIEVLYGGGRKYYKVTWEFALRSGRTIFVGDDFYVDDHRTWLIDYGMSKLVAGELVALKDKLGRPLTSPRLLDNAGGVLGIGETPKLRPPFIAYNALSFAALGLPQII